LIPAPSSLLGAYKYEFNQKLLFYQFNLGEISGVNKSRRDLAGNISFPGGKSNQKLRKEAGNGDCFEGYR